MDFAYPRPQLRRSQWTSLNGVWRFRFDDDREFSLPSDITEWPMQIVVPFPLSRTQAASVIADFIERAGTNVTSISRLPTSA